MFVSFCIDLPQVVFFWAIKSDKRATKSRRDDLSHLHGLEFNLHIVSGKLLHAMTSWTRIVDGVNLNPCWCQVRSRKIIHMHIGRVSDVNYYYNLGFFHTNEVSSCILIGIGLLRGRPFDSWEGGVGGWFLVSKFLFASSLVARTKHKQCTSTTATPSRVKNEETRTRL